MDAAANFGPTTVEDDDADSGDVDMIGRWHDFAGEQGWAICDSPTVTDIQAWLFNWGTLISSTITPVQNDAEVRAMFQAKLSRQRLDLMAMAVPSRAVFCRFGLP